MRSIPIILYMGLKCSIDPFPQTSYMGLDDFDKISWDEMPLITIPQFL